MDSDENNPNPSIRTAKQMQRRTREWLAQDRCPPHVNKTAEGNIIRCNRCKEVVGFVRLPKR